MTFPEFDKFFDDFIAECRHMRDSKGKEYANSEDRFANFNRLSDQLGISNQKVGMVYLTKHLDSIRQYLKTGIIHSNERIRGRYIDAVTYLILMAGMAEEDNIAKNESACLHVGSKVKSVGHISHYNDIGEIISISPTHADVIFETELSTTYKINLSDLIPVIGN